MPLIERSWHRRVATSRSMRWAVIAQQIAAQQGGTTLEALMAKRGIQMPAWDATNPTVVKAWQDISAEYASGGFWNGACSNRAEFATWKRLGNGGIACADEKS